MDFTKSQFVSYILAYGGVIGIIWFLFSNAEDTLKPKVKKDISKWLKNIDPIEPVKNWPDQFAAVFDRIFGEKHLSWRCFLRSSIASFSAIAIMIFIWLVLYPASFLATFEGMTSVEGAFVVLVFGSIVNLIPDYLSLLETRCLLLWMSRKSGKLWIFLLLVLDLIVTSLIISIIGLIVYTAIIGWSVWKLATSLGLTVEYPLKLVIERWIELLGRIWNLTTTGGFPVNPAIFFYTTFFTSIWLWIYALSGFSVKLAQKLNISLTWFKGKFDIDKKPLRSMALVSMLIVTIIFVVVPFLK